VQPSITRLCLFSSAFALALVTGLACDVSMPSTLPTSTGAVGKAAGAAACPELSSGNVLGATFTSDAKLNADIKAFVQASADIQRLADNSYAAVTKACAAIGRDLGVPAEQLQGDANDKVSKPCAAVGAKIDQIIKANAAVQVRYQPPRCQMDANFRAKCDAECGLEVDPGKVAASCEPAQLSGYCQGTCTGRCEGTCTGECQGECSAKDAQGRCVGECKGTCKGSCDATCHAKCEGTWKAPRCETEVQPGSAKAECAASCDSSAKVRASCQPPKLAIDGAAQAAAMQTLVASLRTNLPALIQAQVRLGQQLGGDIQAVVGASKRLQGRLDGAGNKAVACVSAAASGLVSATAKINVSVKASASVSAKAGAKAG
jgi:hypothetical protein